MNWKTIDKLEAKVPGAQNSYKGEMCEFDVRLGRHYSPLRIDIGGEQTTDDERFRIENKTLDIAVEAATLHEAKQMLREKLAGSEDFSGTWILWMGVDVTGGYDASWNSETGDCTIKTKFVAELTTGKGKRTRKRHMDIKENLPDPFVGEFWRPTTHKELSRLREGGVLANRRSAKDEVWVEVTPELVETVRRLQRKLGESGEAVKEALSKKRFLETLETVRSGGRLLGAGLVDDLK